MNRTRLARKYRRRAGMARHGHRANHKVVGGRTGAKHQKHLKQLLYEVGRARKRKTQKQARRVVVSREPGWMAYRGWAWWGRAEVSATKEGGVHNA